MPPMAGRALLVFDADDTLWFTEPLYDNARTACRKIVESAGIDGQTWEDLQRERDVTNVARFGLSQKRFPTSCLEAYQALSGTNYNAEVGQAISEAARQVFIQTAPLASGLIGLLEKLASEFRLVLLTQGDVQVQSRRLHDSEAAELFSDIRITDRKSTDSFRAVLEDDGRPASLAWSIGNSLPSDINPALEVGMNAIWVPAHVWEHEKRAQLPVPGRLVRVSTLGEIADVLFAAT
jgi:putative hydrolase of the HAD superfamily